MSECLVRWYYGETCDHIYPDCRNRRQDYMQESEPALPTFDAHGTDVCGMCLHRHNRTHHKGEKVAIA